MATGEENRDGRDSRAGDNRAGDNRDDRVGEIVENYRLKSVLGAGSTSVVYLGQRLEDEHALVAVKVLTFHDAAGVVDRAAFRTRFLREARAARRLRHEHILPVLSYGEIDDLTYMVMPLVTGGTLAMRMTSVRTPLPLDEIARYTRQLASALDYAHEQGIVHRDVKPSNILLDEQGKLYLTDFGIARLFDTGSNTLTAGQIGLTSTGQVLGTPYYMAPEQIKGEPVGPATDIYALGVVVYQMVTGQVPYQGDTPLAVALQHLQDEPCPPSLLRSGLPTPAETAILRAMAKQPSDRFARAAELADALERAVREGQPAGRRETPNDTRTASLALPPDLESTGSDPYQHLVGTTLGSYRLEQLLGVSDLGPIFHARSGAEGALYRLRVLAIPGGQPAESRSIFLGRFQQLAHTVAELQHPYIVPLVDYGSAHGLPYLVSPHVAGPSLAAHLAQTGPMELLAVGRYLDRIAAALEYAHEHSLLHRTLTTECIYVPSPSELAVADFEVRRMVELGNSPGAAPSLYHNTDACAPEQLQGKPVDTYTDVYALGVVLYALLTGRPIYSGATKDDIAQQHLYATVPPLRRWRSGLPAALENILARALAKEPEQRFRHPAELSSAYRQIVGSGSGSFSFGNIASSAGPMASSFPSGSQPAFVTPAGQVGATDTASGAIAPTMMGGSGAAEPRAAQLPPNPGASTPLIHDAAAYRTVDPAAPGSPIEGTLLVPPALASGRGAPPGAPPQQHLDTYGPDASRRDSPPPGSQGSQGASAYQLAPVLAPRTSARAVRTNRRLPVPGWVLGVGAGVVLFALLLGMFIACNPRGLPVSGGPGYADASFGTPSGDVGYRANESLSISAFALADPPQGTRYAGWLANIVDANSDPKSWIRLGPLTKQQNQWTVTFTGNPGTNLMALGNTLEIIREDAAAQPPLAPAPTDPVMLQGTYPTGVYQHVQHLLVAWPDTPHNAGLLVAMRHQTYILQGEAHAVKEAAYRGDAFAMSCHAQSVLDIIEGKPGADYAALDPNCVNTNVTDQLGDGYGFLGVSGQGNYGYEPYIQAVEYHMDKAAQALGNATSSLPELTMHAGHVHRAMENVRTLLSAAQQDALKLRQNPGMSTATDVAGDLAAKCDAALQWAQPEGAAMDPTQFGVLDAYTHAQLATSLRLTPPAVAK